MNPDVLKQQLEEQLSRVARLRFRQDEEALGEQLLALAQLHGMAEDHAAAAKIYAEAQPVLRKKRKLSEQAEAVLGQAVATMHTGDTREALLLISDAVAICREAKDAKTEGNCNAAAAEICRSLGDDEAAREGFKEALVLFRSVHAHGREAQVLVDLGDLEMVAARYAEARALFAEALPLASEAGDAALAAQCALLLGESAGLIGDHAEARDVLLQAQPHYTAVGPAALTARVAWDLGLSHYYLGEYDAAEAQLRIAREYYGLAGHPDEVTRTDQALAAVNAKRVRN